MQRTTDLKRLSSQHMPASPGDTTDKCITTRANIPDGVATLQQAVDALADWGTLWRVRFEPTKSQALTITHRRSHNPVPSITFQWTDVPEVDQLRLLGVTFDSQVCFKQHIRSLAIRGAQRLSFFCKDAMALNSRCHAVVYRGFVRPILEYGMLVWMSATPSILAKLTAIQHRALHVIDDGCYLASLDIRRTVAAGSATCSSSTT